MGYALNFNLIWRHFDKLWGGLLLSLELAVISIAIGIV
ncbi:MAG: amino acid ABC transporter permease, partial [Mesorhizobium sp.]